MTIARREFLAGLAGLGGAAATRALISPAQAQVAIADGVAAGDVTPDSAVIWARASTTSKMVVEWSTDAAFRSPTRLDGPIATGRTGNSAQLAVNGLPSGREIFYRVRFETPDGGSSVPQTGRLVTPGGTRDMSFVFGGDQCGAGWGINPEWGGLRLFETMRDTQPDFLIHLGDRIYADRIMLEEVRMPDGRIWKNVVTPAKREVAEQLWQFRGNYGYNFLDEHYRRFAAEVPMLATWDDHEVTDDWWPNRQLTWKQMHRKGYGLKDVDTLVARGRQAFFEYTPMRRNAADPDRIYRVVPCGPLADVFLLDCRSYRSANDRNRDNEAGTETAMLGRAQIDWLKSELARSKALWKIIANPLPLAHLRHLQRPRYDKWANGDSGQPLGRELEAAEILSFVKQNNVSNTVWLAGDVHYAAAHFFGPARAAFKDFNPFWEFTAGPFHTRPGPGQLLDRTFGPEQRFRTPVSQVSNPPPMDGFLYFGHAHIDAGTGALRITFRDLTNRTLFSQVLEAIT